MGAIRDDNVMMTTSCLLKATTCEVEPLIDAYAHHPQLHKLKDCVQVLKCIVLQSAFDCLTAYPSSPFTYLKIRVQIDPSPGYIYVETPQFDGSCSGAVSHPRDFETRTGTLQLHGDHDGLVKASEL